jgi:hypothetical protein
VAANGSFSGKTFKEKCWTMMLCFFRKNLNQIMPEADLFLKQAGMTAHHYLFQAVKSIDQAFGEGYAKANPELVGVFIQTCAADFHSGWVTQEIASALKEIAVSLSQISHGD